MPTLLISAFVVTFSQYLPTKRWFFTLLTQLSFGFLDCRPSPLLTASQQPAFLPSLDLLRVRFTAHAESMSSFTFLWKETCTNRREVCQQFVSLLVFLFLFCWLFCFLKLYWHISFLLYFWTSALYYTTLYYANINAIFYYTIWYYTNTILIP